MNPHEHRGHPHINKQGVINLGSTLCWICRAQREPISGKDRSYSELSKEIGGRCDGDKQFEQFRDGV